MGGKLFRLVCPAVLLFLLCGFLFSYRLGERDLWSSHEARAAQDAQSILDGGSWGLPHLFDKRPELQKPPLYYWLVATIGFCQGGRVDAWSVRLPAALTATLGVLALYFWGVRCGRPTIGLIAACVLATAIHYTSLARTGRIDMPLTLAVTVSLTSFFLALRRRRELRHTQAVLWLLSFYVAVAIAVLFKGPIGFVLPAAVVIVHLAVDRRLAAPWRLGHWANLCHELGLWWGLPVLLVLALPWYLWAQLQTDGAFFQSFIWRHNIERALGGADGMRDRPWYTYGPYLAGYFLPWSLLLPFAMWRVGRDRDDAEARFGLIWLATIVVVLSCVGFKRADYLLPAFPAAALILGCAGESWLRSSLKPRRLVIGFSSILIACLGGWLVYLHWVVPAQEPGLEYRRFAAEIRRRVPAPQLVLFFRAEAHALAFHLGPELDTFLEWENLDIWAGRPGCHYIVMPVQCAEEWRRHVRSGQLREVLRSTDFAGAENHRRPLVLMRTEANPSQGGGGEVARSGGG
jgi:4-amino-4-deoxy-L-arabinose transferase-like glycosyltransferase